MFVPDINSILQSARNGAIRHWELEFEGMKIRTNGPADTDDFLRAFPTLPERIERRLDSGYSNAPAPRPSVPPSAKVPEITPVPPRSPETVETVQAPVEVPAPRTTPPVAALKAPGPASARDEGAPPEATDLESLAVWHLGQYVRTKPSDITPSVVRRTLDLFIAVCGNRDINDIGFGEMERFADALTVWPKSVQNIKEYKDESIKDILESNRKDKKYPAISRSTQENHLQHLSAFFNHALRWRLRTDKFNPVLFINRTREYGSGRAHPKRAPDDVEWMSTLDKAHMDSVDAPHKFFGTLLLSYTGARTNEIAQLRRSDIRTITMRDRQGAVHRVPCMHIRTTEQGQHVKSKYSIRVLPVPSQVLALGFENYLADLDALGAKDLFPGLQKAEDRPGNSISGWYNKRLRRELGITDKAVTLHCLRHYISTMAAYSNVPAFLLDALFGQSNQPHIRMTGGEVLRNVKYVDGPTPLDLRNALDQMCFPELDIAPYQQGRFDHYLKYELARLATGERRVGKVPSKGAFKPKPPRPKETPETPAAVGTDLEPETQMGGGTPVASTVQPKRKRGRPRRTPVLESEKPIAPDGAKDSS